ncbi:hypothetical protein [Jiangella gansuensis]|uniref:hypothetical protein n=1 Tax=Jiangella gansuensis TaxID=281473 RepID=UPI00047EC341|nr:hypothetical protein [Jiangella gansuensis]
MSESEMLFASMLMDLWDHASDGERRLMCDGFEQYGGEFVVDAMKTNYPPDRPFHDWVAVVFLEEVC